MQVIKSRRMRWERHVARIGDWRDSYRVFVGGHLMERDQLENLGIDEIIIIKMHIQDEGWGSMDWIDLAQDRDRWQALVNAVMKFWGLQNAGNFLTRC
jgi:hypothetical protein